MVAVYSNRSKLRALEAALGLPRPSAPLMALLVSDSYVLDADHSVVSDVNADEIAAIGYARQVVTIVNVLQVDAADRAEAQLATTDFGVLPGGETVRGAWLFRDPATATVDTERELVAFIDGADLPLDGTTFRVLYENPTLIQG